MRKGLLAGQLLDTAMYNNFIKAYNKLNNYNIVMNTRAFGIAGKTSPKIMFSFFMPQLAYKLTLLRFQLAEKGTTFDTNYFVLDSAFDFNENNITAEFFDGTYPATKTSENIDVMINERVFTLNILKTTYHFDDIASGAKDVFVKAKMGTLGVFETNSHHCQIMAIIHRETKDEISELSGTLTTDKINKFRDSLFAGSSDDAMFYFSKSLQVYFDNAGTLETIAISNVLNKKYFIDDDFRTMQLFYRPNGSSYLPYIYRYIGSANATDYGNAQIETAQIIGTQTAGTGSTYNFKKLTSITNYKDLQQFVSGGYLKFANNNADVKGINTMFHVNIPFQKTVDVLFAKEIDDCLNNYDLKIIKENLDGFVSSFFNGFLESQVIINTGNSNRLVIPFTNPQKIDANIFKLRFSLPVESGDPVYVDFAITDKNTIITNQ